MFTHHQLITLLALVEDVENTRLTNGGNSYNIDNLKASINREISKVSIVRTGIFDAGLGDLTFSFFYSTNKISAIKTFRDAMNCGLKEAFNIVDQAVKNPDGKYQILIKNSNSALFDSLMKLCSENRGFDSCVRLSTKEILSDSTIVVL